MAQVFTGSGVREVVMPVFTGMWLQGFKGPVTAVPCPLRRQGHTGQVPGAGRGRGAGGSDRTVGGPDMAASPPCKTKLLYIFTLSLHVPTPSLIKLRHKY